MKPPHTYSLGLALASGIFASSTSASVVIDWVTIGDPGNAAQSVHNRSHYNSGGDGYGAVADSFRISRNETTLTDYVEFLNAKATTDAYDLYNTSMGSDASIAGITRSGSSGSYTYSVLNSGVRPITYVSWFDAARFTNWMHNGQGNGDTETGAYTLVGGQISGMAPAKNVGATVWIPTENEWFKAAYYDGENRGYWLHANRNNYIYSNSIGAPGAANHADGNTARDENGLPTNLSDAGAYGMYSQSFYGINDMAGNVLEWNDMDAESGLVRVLRGGDWLNDADYLKSSYRVTLVPLIEDYTIGFRVASVPEPNAIVLTMFFIAGLVWRRKR